MEGNQCERGQAQIKLGGDRLRGLETGGWEEVTLTAGSCPERKPTGLPASYLGWRAPVQLSDGLALPGPRQRGRRLGSDRHCLPSLLASLGHTGRRRVVLGQPLNTHRHLTKTDEQKKVLSTFMICAGLCLQPSWAARGLQAGHPRLNRRPGVFCRRCGKSV